MMSVQKKIFKQVLMVFPLVVVGLAAFGFHALGGGRSLPVDAAVRPGINTSLPEAQFTREAELDKMGNYERAVRDSAKLNPGGLDAAAARLGFAPQMEDQEQQIHEKLSAINKQISLPYAGANGNLVAGGGAGGNGVRPESAPANMTRDVAKLEALMKAMQSGEGEPDPELTQLGVLMDKLIAVQNPELASSLYGKKDGLDSAIGLDVLFAAIPAVVSVDQKARQGSVIELRLLDTAVFSGVVVPAGHLIYGLANFSNQRISLEIKHIRLGKQVVPVNLTVFDQRDAMAGINAPEALLSEAVSGGVVNASSGFGISGFDLGTQLAGAGIDAAKSLLAKKVHRVKQQLKAGYPVLLRDNGKK